jgi:hypothetical protein
MANAAEADPGWFDRPMRWAQLNLTEDDPAKMDVGFGSTTSSESTPTEPVSLPAVSWPSTNEIPLHRPSWLKGHESFYPDLVAGCRKLNMIVLARTRSARHYQDVYDAHPDWIASIPRDRSAVTGRCRTCG